jgi:glutathione S-transferase
MYQLHYFPANTNAAPHMSLEDIGVKYDLVLAPPASKKEPPARSAERSTNPALRRLVRGRERTLR